MGIPASETVQGRRIRWKAGKEDELWEYMQERLGAGDNISEALKAFADRNGISWLTARWKYYRLKQDRASGGNAGQGRSDDAIDSLSEFLRSASTLGDTDLNGLLRGLASLARLAMAGANAVSVENRLSEAESALNAARQQYTSLSTTVEQWLESPGVDRVASLKEFGETLRAQVLAVGEALNA